MSRKGLASVEERFWQRVSRKDKDACWLWIGAKQPNGYGRFYPHGKLKIYAHIFSWELHNGPTNGLFVLHSCDTPGCVNPEHLFLGTQLDNVKDMVSKNRLHIHPSFGEKNGRAKLTLGEVNSIFVRRNNGESLSSLAIEYGVSITTISRIGRGLRWQAARG